MTAPFPSLPDAPISEGPVLLLDIDGVCSPYGRNPRIHINESPTRVRARRPGLLAPATDRVAGGARGRVSPDRLDLALASPMCELRNHGRIRAGRDLADPVSECRG